MQLRQRRSFRAAARVHSESRWRRPATLSEEPSRTASIRTGRLRAAPRRSWPHKCYGIHQSLQMNATASTPVPARRPASFPFEKHSVTSNRTGCRWKRSWRSAVARRRRALGGRRVQRRGRLVERRERRVHALDGGLAEQRHQGDVKVEDIKPDYRSGRPRRVRRRALRDGRRVLVQDAHDFIGPGRPPSGGFLLPNECSGTL